jgi:hypothetical protein
MHPACVLQVLAAIAEGVQRDMGELLSAVMAPASGLHAFDFLGGSLMPEVDEAISKAMPGTCGQPFHILGGLSIPRVPDCLSGYPAWQMEGGIHLLLRVTHTNPMCCMYHAEHPS